MDIFEYIDRVKANFDKQPEPKYNTKKYLGFRKEFGVGGITLNTKGPYKGYYSVTVKPGSHQNLEEVLLIKLGNQ